MKISALAAAVDVPVPTLKFYLRIGLLHSGHVTSRTQAEYDDSHVRRVRLIRALTTLADLDLTTVHRVLDALADPVMERCNVMDSAQRVLRDAEDGAFGSLEPCSDLRESRTYRWAVSRGWAGTDKALLALLEDAWLACDEAGMGLDWDRLNAYADAVEAIARTDIATMPPEPDAAVRHVVLGTLLLDPVLAVLRRLAQVQLSQMEQPAVPRGNRPAETD